LEEKVFLLLERENMEEGNGSNFLAFGREN